MRVLNQENPPQTFTPIFPETWFWTLVHFGSLKERNFTTIAPNMTAKWSASAVCFNEEDGLDMSLTSLTTAFNPILVEVRLPKTAVTGENLQMRVIVYNRVENCSRVQLKVPRIVLNGPWNIQFCVCKEKPYEGVFHFRAEYKGTQSVRVQARAMPGTCQGRRRRSDVDASFAGKFLEFTRTILIKAEGVEMSYTYASYLCARDGKPVWEKVELPLPEGKEMIRNSAHGEVQVIGDIMGAALNLEYLVHMPTRCGEQNMIGFVSNILVLNYLNSTGDLQENTRQTALSNMEIDYQHALNYRHSDGSFSAFGAKGSNGSVWLTAFIVKSFAQAQKYIFIDENVLQRAVDFLAQSQLETGCFRETGKVFSSYMMGGLGQGWELNNGRSPQGALTAYVLMALMEAGKDTNDPIIKLGIKCVNDKLNVPKNRLDPYTLALVTLANMRYNSTSDDTRIAFKLMHGKARKDDKHIYWTRGKSNPSATDTGFLPTAPSAEVEMASYALMSYLQFSPNDAERVAMWLSRQRNSFGGFASTQDTVVALEALSQFAASVYSRDAPDLKIKIKFKSTPAPSSAGFYVHKAENKLQLQREPIPALPSTLHISTRGTGCALVQASVHYNKPVGPYVKGEKNHFFLRIFVRPYQHDPDRCDYRTLNIKVM
ncbi:alpha-2-macroglobulin-like protein [Plakobranchus ocellatus]|uniref:Alpha-2-macroglobulin-like protein n=1 Tax=Plakobranchus ocellatus TaxID=259542 RepID=A0AAV4CX48_9GAST|nr:alpha-2-macroglobulin-like protein [Plakobranchus ocellatus]